MGSKESRYDYPKINIEVLDNFRLKKMQNNDIYCIFLSQIDPIEINGKKSKYEKSDINKACEI